MHKPKLTTTKCPVCHLRFGTCEHTKGTRFSLTSSPLTMRTELQQQTPNNLALHGTLTHEECATILHGLRLIQCEGRIEGCAAGDCEHFDDTLALTNDQIDALAERINSDAVLSKTWTPADCPNYQALQRIEQYVHNALAAGHNRAVDQQSHEYNAALQHIECLAAGAIDVHRAKIEAHKQGAFYHAIEWTWADGDDNRFYSGAYLTPDQAHEIRKLIDSKAEEADLTCVEVYRTSLVNQDFDAAKTEVLDALAQVIG